MCDIDCLAHHSVMMHRKLELFRSVLHWALKAMTPSQPASL